MAQPIDFLVTGGAGFIGSHLTEALVNAGRRVRVVDNFSTGKRDNLGPLDGSYEFIEGDIADGDTCRRACENVRVVLHHAAIPSVPKSVADPTASHRANIEGTLQMLLAARDAKVRRFVNAGSSSAYGETPTLPKVETITPDPISPYAVQKLTAEHYCRVFSRCYGLQTVTLRYFNVFGPRQDPSSAYAAAIPAFVSAILADRAPTIFGDGEQTRDFTYIQNVIRANLLAAETPRTAGEAVNIACGERVTLNEVVAAINQILGKRVAARHVAPREGDIQHSWADVSAAERVIGYRPEVRFAEGLERTVKWYRDRARN